MTPPPSPGRPRAQPTRGACRRRPGQPGYGAIAGPLPADRSWTGDRADREDDSQHLVLRTLSPADGGAWAGRGCSFGSHSAQLTRTAAAVTDRWAPKNFHIAVDARGPRASTNDPLAEPPDQA
jgi:hypothetical protein